MNPTIHPLIIKAVIVAFRAEPIRAQAHCKERIPQVLAKPTLDHVSILLDP
jgi:hypothetical protein